MTANNGGGSSATARLIKLLYQLHPSSAEGEIRMAVQSIQKIMRDGGLTWEKLLSDKPAQLTEDQFRKVFNAGVQQGEMTGYDRGYADAQVSIPGPTKQRITIGLQLPWLEKLLEAAAKAEADGRLTAKEIDFTNDQRRRMRQYGRGTQFTQPQLDWLKGIEQSLRRRGYL